MEGGGFEGPKRNILETHQVKEFVSKVSREEVRDLGRLEQGRPWIVLPEEFYAVTEQMCQGERETRGVLLINKQNEAYAKNRLAVEAIIPIGYGSPDHVFPDDAKLNAINRLLQENQETIGAIDFHSHTIGTVSQYGSYYGENFSGGDNQSLVNGVDRVRLYKHVLFTPTNILTFGMDNPQFAVADFDNVSAGSPIEKHLYWQNKFQEYIEQARNGQ